MMGRGFDDGFGSGMMGRSNRRDGYGAGMMGGRDISGVVKPLTVDEAKTAVDSYLATLNNSDLQLKEIMVFDNNAYARIVEKSTGTGALELLVDPVTKSVYPEHGPNMMWNLKYSPMGSGGMMSGRGMMGGGASQYGTPLTTTVSDNTVTPEQALTAAQSYLDTNLAGDKTATDADKFYGYYTIDILRDGKTVGMLSVNGFSSQVFVHAWHGTYIDMKEY